MGRVKLFEDDGEYELHFDCGDLPTDAAVVDAGFEPNGYFWERVSMFLAPEIVDEIDFDSESGMFAAWSDSKAALELLRDRLEPVLEGPSQVAAAIERARVAQFDLDPPLDSSGEWNDDADSADAQVGTGWSGASTWSDLDSQPELRTWAARNKATPASVLRRLAADPDPRLRSIVAGNSNLDPDVLESLVSDNDEGVRARVIHNRGADLSLIRQLLTDESPMVRRAAREVLARRSRA